MRLTTEHKAIIYKILSTFYFFLSMILFFGLPQEITHWECIIVIFRKFKHGMVPTWQYRYCGSTLTLTFKLDHNIWNVLTEIIKLFQFCVAWVWIGILISFNILAKNLHRKYRCNFLHVRCYYSKTILLLFHSFKIHHFVCFNCPLCRIRIVPMHRAVWWNLLPTPTKYMAICLTFPIKQQLKQNSKRNILLEKLFQDMLLLTFPDQCRCMKF